MATALQIDAQNKEAAATQNYGKLVEVSKQLQREYLQAKTAASNAGPIQDQLRITLDQNTRLQEQLRRAEEDKFSAEGQIEAYKAREVQCRDMILKLSGQITSLKAEVSGNPAAVNQAVEVVTNLFEQKIAKYREEVQSLQQQLEDAQKSLIQANKQLQDQKIASSTQSSKELQKQRDQLASDHQTTVDELTKLYEGQIADISKMKLASMQEYENRIEKLNSQLQDVQKSETKQKETVEKLTQENENLRTKLEQTKDDLSEANAALQEKSSASAASSQSLGAIESELNMTKKLVETMKKREREAKSGQKKAQEEAIKAKNDLVDLQKQASEILFKNDATIEQLRRELAEKTANVDQESKRAQSVSQHERKKAQAEMDKLKASLESTRQEFEQTRTRLNEENSALALELSSAKRELSKKASEANTAASGDLEVISSLRAENKSLTEAFERTKKVLEGMKSDYQKLRQNQLEGEAQKEKDFQIKVSEYQNQINDLQRQVNENKDKSRDASTSESLDKKSSGSSGKHSTIKASDKTSSGANSPLPRGTSSDAPSPNKTPKGTSRTKNRKSVALKKDEVNRSEGDGKTKTPKKGEEDLADLVSLLNTPTPSGGGAAKKNRQSGHKKSASEDIDALVHMLGDNFDKETSYLDHNIIYSPASQTPTIEMPNVAISISIPEPSPVPPGADVPAEDLNLDDVMAFLDNLVNI